MCGSEVATCIEESNSNNHGFDYSTKNWNFVLEFQSHVSFEETWKPPQTKNKQKFCPSFHWENFVSY